MYDVVMCVLLQYAHKLAYMAGQNLRVRPNDKLSNVLYYL